MTGNEFLDRVKACTRRQGLGIDFDPGAGKGSHGKLFLGERHTFLKDRREEIGKGLLSKMCRDLGTSTRDLKDR